MWAYKLDKAINLFGMTRPAISVRKVIHDAYMVTLAKYQTDTANRDAWDDLEPVPFPADTVMSFDRDVVVAKNMARSLHWDTTMSGELQCYLVPGPDAFMYGFILTQATSGERFVISPVPLPYLEEHISWNAHTSVDEVQKARAALDGGEFGPPQITWNGEWKRSRAGNQYCYINGAQVTIFQSKREPGYCAVIASQTTELKVFTRAFPNELECAAYVVKHFYTLIKEWVDDPAAAGQPANDNPFAGIDWGDDDA